MGILYGSWGIRLIFLGIQVLAWCWHYVFLGFYGPRIHHQVTLYKIKRAETCLSSTPLLWVSCIGDRLLENYLRALPPCPFLELYLRFPLHLPQSIVSFQHAVTRALCPDAVSMRNHNGLHSLSKCTAQALYIQSVVDVLDDALHSRPEVLDTFFPGPHSSVACLSVSNP